MRKQTLRQYRFMVALALVLSLGSASPVAADTQQSHSSNYSVSDVQIGGNGSALKDCSTSYCARESLGDTVVGSGSSANYSAQFGTFTTDQPLLEVIVDGGPQDVGVLQPDTTATVNDTIKIRSYLSSGYTLYITGAAPSQGVHHLTTLTSGCPCSSQPGHEQFGINLAANTTPNIGSGPMQVPSGVFSFGTVNTNYGQSNKFQYVNGDAVANSVKSTGETDYTLSMILNISNVTPAGKYTGSFSAVVVPIF
jgi:hypothetical protein